jgi:hypothetical protein
MDVLKNIIYWILIILFFPMSLLFVAYAKRRKAEKDYLNGKTDF